MKKEKWYKNQKIIIPMFIVLGLFIIIGTSYALWQITLQQTDTNVITTGCLKLTLTEETDAINLASVSPTSDEDGKKLTPYTFTIENTCTTDTNYVINLETTSTGDKILADNYVKAHLISNTDQLFLDKLLEKHINEEKVITDATNAYKLYQGTLGNKEKKQFSLRLWLDEETEAVDSVMNATWQGKITVTGKFVQNSNRAKIMEILSVSHDAQIWKYRDSTTKIVFENTIHDIEGAVESFNIASDKTDNAEKIMAYVVANTEDTTTHTIYIQGNGGVMANENSSYLFCSFSKLKDIEHLEYLDTSQVVNMYSMFSYCTSLTNLDLSHFNTSNAENMEDIFEQCTSLTSLDLSNFNTSKVTNMSDMFKDSSALVTINLSSFDTSQVTAMSGMFEDCYNLSSLDVSNFNTSQVTSMGSMFAGLKSITSLNLSNLNTSKVTNMGGMFAECISLTTLDLSSFDTSNVTNMVFMFCECTSLANLDLSQFDTSKVTNMSSMFSGCGKLTTTINIMNPNTKEYSFMLSGTASNDGSKVVLNYTSATSALVDKMLDTKFRDEHVEKGIEIAI